MNENNLQRKDIRNVSLSLFRERWRQLSTLPTSKQENFVIVNDQDSGIVIFSKASNVACLCNDVEDIFIDGTFKCCPRYFYHGNYVPLVWRKIQSLGLSALYKDKSSDVGKWLSKFFGLPFQNSSSTSLWFMKPG
jgi:hypothetical protein